MTRLFFFTLGLFSLAMVIDSYMNANGEALIGWLVAMVLSIILGTEDLFESRNEKIQEIEDKRLAAFNKLMNAEDKS